MLTQEELEFWEMCAANAIRKLIDYEICNCKKKVQECEVAAEYADQMVIEWRKRKGSTDNGYRDRG